jgi:cell division protein FtsQ
MAREAKKETPRWQNVLRKVGLVAFGIVVFSAIAFHMLHRYVINDRKFMLSRERREYDWVNIEGLRYGSRTKVQHIFADDADRSLFAVPIDERRRRLLAIDWVQDAAVSRIWPDRLAVRITERRPLAFVQVQSTVMLIDGEGMLLELPSQAQFTFPVLSGVRAEDPPPRRLEAVRALLDVEEGLGDQMKDVSEVNASDPGNIKIVAQVNRHVVDLILGEDNFGPRYRNFLKHYPEMHRRSPELRSFDLRLDGRITAKE